MPGHEDCGCGLSARSSTVGSSDIRSTRISSTEDFRSYPQIVVVPATGSVAILLSRAGNDPVTTDDRSWAFGLTKAAQRQGIRMWPVHFANDVELRVFAPDDLIG